MTTQKLVQSDSNDHPEAGPQNLKATLDKLKYKGGEALDKSNSQILKDGDKPQVIPSNVKLPYPYLAKEKKNEEGQFKKFMELFSQLQCYSPKELPPKLKDPGAFTIPCSIGPVDIGRALCDLGESINLIPVASFFGGQGHLINF
ncbi:hypothetical protein MTR_6g035050 [Medicago truncatula]|uniref:Uncharacterized protein n=1 Tax=Medicago truncatula TaxID=3880 RepID=A0A072U8Y0_MEDTR|nr:hypothetical protein MTR_6g035050 [Medicago truncatula]